jgi:hypothetical protein
MYGRVHVLWSSTMTAIVANAAGGGRRSYQRGRRYSTSYTIFTRKAQESSKRAQAIPATTTTTKHRSANMPEPSSTISPKSRPGEMRAPRLLRGILLRRLAIQQRQHEPRWRTPSVIYSISITPSQLFPLPFVTPSANSISGASPEPGRRQIIQPPNTCTCETLRTPMKTLTPSSGTLRFY